MDKFVYDLEVKYNKHLDLEELKDQVVSEVSNMTNIVEIVMVDELNASPPEVPNVGRRGLSSRKKRVQLIECSSAFGLGAKQH